MSKRLIVLIALCAQSCAATPGPNGGGTTNDTSFLQGEAAAGLHPFDEKADAEREIDGALLAARASGKRVLLVFGGNWCHDSRSLAAKFAKEPLTSLIEGSFEIAWVDVGHRDRNLDQLQRFGVDRIVGTPTVLILSPSGELLNRETVNEWRTADSKSIEETSAYFEGYAQSIDN